MNHPAHFFGSTDDGIELALEGGVGQITRVLRQRFVAVFSVRVVGFFRAADLLQHRRELIARYAAALEKFGASGVERGEGEEKVLCRNVLILELAGLFHRGLQKGVDSGRKDGLAPGLFRKAVEDSVDVGRELLCVDTQPLERRRNHTALLIESRLQEVFRSDFGVIGTLGKRLCVGDDLLGSYRELILSHEKPPRNPSLESGFYGKLINSVKKSY